MVIGLTKISYINVLTTSQNNFRDRNITPRALMLNNCRHSYDYNDFGSKANMWIETQVFLPYSGTQNSPAGIIIAVKIHKIIRHI